MTAQSAINQNIFILLKENNINKISKCAKENGFKFSKIKTMHPHL